jgi:hypothetical protein
MILKRAIAVLFLLIWVSQIAGRHIISLEFYLNQQFIAKNLCENRDKPYMHCNGKCQLRKKLREEDKRDQENPERKADAAVSDFTLQQAGQQLYKPLIPASIKDYEWPSAIGTPVDQPHFVFRPPLA